MDQIVRTGNIHSAKHRGYHCWLSWILLVVFITSPARAQHIEAEEIWCLEWEDVAPSGSIGDVVAGKDSTFFVADSHDHVIYHLSASGSILNELHLNSSEAGRRIRLSFDGENLYVFTPSTRFVIASDFSSVVEFEHTLTGYRYTAALPGVGLAVANESGLEGPPATLLMGYRSGEAFVVYRQAPFDPPFLPEIGIPATNGKDRIALGFMTRGIIEVLDREGNHLTTLEIDDLPITPEYRAVYNAAYERDTYIPSKSVVADLTIDDESRLFVLGAQVVDHPMRRVYVMSLEGDQLGTFLLPERATRIRHDSSLQMLVAIGSNRNRICGITVSFAD